MDYHAVYVPSFAFNVAFAKLSKNVQDFPAVRSLSTECFAS